MQQPSPQFPNQPPLPVASYPPQGGYIYGSAQQMQQQPYISAQAMQQHMLQQQQLIQQQQLQQQHLQQQQIQQQQLQQQHLQQQQMQQQPAIGGAEGVTEQLPRSSSSGNVQTGQLIQIDDDVVDSSTVSSTGRTQDSTSREVTPPTNTGEETFKLPALPKATASNNQKVGVIRVLHVGRQVDYIAVSIVFIYVVFYWSMWVTYGSM